MRVVVSQYEGIDATPVLPLAAGCLVASARTDPELAGTGFAIALERLPIAQAVAEHGRPDVLGFSLYPWNATYSLAVAAAARAANRDSLIVAGGPSVPRRPERARRFLEENPAVDVLVFGEGELAFRELVRARSRALIDLSSDFSSIGGIAFRDDDGTLRFTTPPDRVHDFTITSSPYLDGTFDELYERHRNRFSMALCETNRGCPFSCTFCDWSLTKKVVEFPIERVMGELDWVVAHGFSHVMLADANFGIRTRDAAIARRLVELRQRTGRPASFYFYLTKNNHSRNLEIVEILQGGGIRTWVGLAVQDFDAEVLSAVKRDKIQTGEAMKLRDICGERGIPTFNELILGLPGQTYRSFAQTIATAMPALPRHDFVLFLCRMIDNTELGDPESRARFGIETRRCRWKASTPGWDPIVEEYQEVVVATRDMPLADWRRTYRLSFLAAAFYNLRLLRVALHHVVDATGISLADYLTLLADSLLVAEPGSVYAELDATLERYVESLLGGGPFVLPFHDGAGAPPILVDEAVAIVARRRYDSFLAETEATTRRIATSSAASETIAEAFRYQSFITPRCGHPEPVDASFAHDWPAYVAAGGTGTTLIAQPTIVRFTPVSSLASPNFSDFATSQFACIRGGLDLGRIERLASGRVRWVALA
jgi:putative methyltransferase